MTGPPAARPEFQSAPPTKRANPDWIPVRLYDGTLVAHVHQEFADRLLENGAIETFRNGARRYLRLRQGITIPLAERGWDVIEFLRTRYGDKRAAGYVAHNDRESERLQYRPPSTAPERLRTAPRLPPRPVSNACEQVSKSNAPADKGAK